MAWHRCITALNIEMEEKYLQKLLDTSQPINVFFKVIDGWVKYANEANIPFMLVHILQMLNHDLWLSVIYTDACKDWCRNQNTENACVIF